MVEQLQGPFEKFKDWRQCAAVMPLCLPLSKVQFETKITVSPEI
jgi:hypothetical protein